MSLLKLKDVINSMMTLNPKDSSKLKISSVSQLTNSTKSSFSTTFSPWKKPDNHCLPKNPPVVTATTK